MHIAIVSWQIIHSELLCVYLLFFRDTADRTVSGSGKLEEIMVCGQEINASTAQLVSASRVKAKPNSSKQAELEQQSRNGKTKMIIMYLVHVLQTITCI